ncbi:MAG: hypothetical protein FGM22_10850 [Burkholderiaceae bacterium]|nr:hypothetical protein [Burkholderiaceae bacterium]
MLILTYCDAPAALQAAGIAAAERFFAETGADPLKCWRAAEAVGRGAVYDRDALRAWYLAEDAAVLATYGRWRHAPAAVALEWRPDPDHAARIG